MAAIRNNTNSRSNIIIHNDHDDDDEQEQDLYVLYGSQRGTSEDAAKSFVKQAVEQLSTAAIRGRTGTSRLIRIRPHIQELDQFLEEQQQHRQLPEQSSAVVPPPVVVIFVSSYGFGGAPSGSRQFRKLCDVWMQIYPEATAEGTDSEHSDEHDSRNDDEDDDDDNKDEGKPIEEQLRPLHGLQFALCGLGDSSYTRSFWRNPQRIMDGMMAAGAHFIGTAGQADARTGRRNQTATIQTWIETIWTPLAHAIVDLSTRRRRDEQQRQIQRRSFLNWSMPEMPLSPCLSSDTAIHPATVAAATATAAATTSITKPATTAVTTTQVTATRVS